MNLKLTSIGKLAFLILLVGAGVYWLRFRAVPVVSHTVTVEEIVAEVMGTGTLEARISTSVSPKISGRIETLLADQGDRVKAGDELVRLDSTELEEQVAIARANVEAAEAAIDRLSAERDRAEVVRIQAQKSMDRVRQLAETNSVSQDEFDRGAEMLGIALADVARSEAAILQGQKELTSAEETLHYHQTRFRDTVVVAPFDGMIVKRSREPGDVVVPGSPVLTLISTEELWISAWVDESEMAKLQVGQPCRVVFRSRPERGMMGELARLGREVDRETREFIVDVRVLELPKNWAVGQRAEAYVRIGAPATNPVVPKSFIVTRTEETGVYVLQNGNVSWRSIELGIESDTNIGVRGGLEGGEVVVKPSAKGQRLHSGQRVFTL